MVPRRAILPASHMSAPERARAAARRMRLRAHRITAARAGYYRGMLLIGTVHLFDWVFQAFDLKSSKAIKHVLDDSRETPDARIATFDFGRLSVICSCLHTTALASGRRRLHYSTDVIWFDATRPFDRKVMYCSGERKRPTCAAIQWQRSIKRPAPARRNIASRGSFGSRPLQRAIQIGGYP